MFKISSNPIEDLINKNNLYSDQTGAVSCFEGLVRDHNEGKRVRALEYEAYHELCVNEGQKIIEEAGRRFKINKAVCIHRVGKLKIGEMAVWVGVSAPHRDDAFKACRFIIDEIKVRLPIWKKEYYDDGDSGWVNCECASPGECGERVSNGAFWSCH